MSTAWKGIASMEGAEENHAPSVIDIGRELRRESATKSSKIFERRDGSSNAPAISIDVIALELAPAG